MFNPPAFNYCSLAQMLYLTIDNQKVSLSACAMLIIKYPEILKLPRQDNQNQTCIAMTDLVDFVKSSDRFG